MISPSKAAAALLELATISEFIDWEEFYNKYPELREYDVYLGTGAAAANEKE